MTSLFWNLLYSFVIHDHIICDITLTLTLSLKIREIKRNKDRNENKQSSLSSTLISPLLQNLFFAETDFHFCQFLSNFFRYLCSNFPLSHLYSIFTVHFSDNFFLLKSCSFTKSNFSYLLTSVLILLSNSTTISFVFSKFSFLFQMLYYIINLFHFTKYFTTPLIFLLFRIFSTSHSSIPSISTSFSFFFFWPSTCSLYHTT